MKQIKEPTVFRDTGLLCVVVLRSGKCFDISAEIAGKLHDAIARKGTWEAFRDAPTGLTTMLINITEIVAILSPTSKLD